MRVKVLSLALLAAVVALPVPASLALTGSFSAPSPVAQVIPGHENLRFLLQDPFLIDQMSFERPTSFSGEILPRS
ncbi:MAG: hypothetical protein ABIY37_12240 [Devosia sp.]